MIGGSEVQVSDRVHVKAPAPERLRSTVILCREPVINLGVCMWVGGYRRICVVASFFGRFALPFQPVNGVGSWWRCCRCLAMAQRMNNSGVSEKRAMSRKCFVSPTSSHSQCRITAMFPINRGFTYADLVGGEEDEVAIQIALTPCMFFDMASLQAGWLQSTFWRAW